MKKRILTMPLLLALLLILTSCSKSSTINLISRESGSGTRGAFIELVGLLEKTDSTEKDLTYDEAIIQNTTDGVMTTVRGDKNAIGYISTGSLNDSIKTLSINNIEPNLENIKSNQYPINRPFLIGYKDKLEEVEEDFLSFILSIDGQKIVLEEGYIPIDTDYSYEAKNFSGKIVVGGSTSVTHVMEKLKEAYEGFNPSVAIEIQSTGSSTGIKSTIDGSSDFAMSSRFLTEDESEQLEEVTLALDGIAIIVNKENPIDNLSLKELKGIYDGNITDWSELKN